MENVDIRKKINVFAVIAFALSMLTAVLMLVQIAILIRLRAEISNELGTKLITVALIVDICAVISGLAGTITGIIGAVKLKIYGTGKAFAITAIVIGAVSVIAGLILFFAELVIAVAFGLGKALGGGALIFSDFIF